MTLLIPDRTFSFRLTNHYGKGPWQTIQGPPIWRHAFWWMLAALACLIVVVTVVAMVVAVTVAGARLDLGEDDGARAGVGLLLTGTPLDDDLRGAFKLAAQHSGAVMPLLEGTAVNTPEGVVAAFTELWEAGVRVFLAGGAAVQTEVLCRYLKQAGKEALLVSLTADAATPSCSNLLVSLSPPPAALVTAEVARLAEGGVTRLVPVLMPSREKESLLTDLRSVAATWNVSVASPVYLDAVHPSVMQVSQVLDTVPGAAVWLAVDHHLPYFMGLLRDVFQGRLVMLHAHPAHLAALLIHPAARAAAEVCAVTTVQWAGPTNVDSLAHRRLMGALTPTDALAAALAYHAATLAIDSAVGGSVHQMTHLKTQLMEEVSRWGAAPAGEKVVRKAAGMSSAPAQEQVIRPATGMSESPAENQVVGMPAWWAARLRLVQRHLVETMVMQDSPWLLEGMTRVHEDNSSSSWMVRRSYAPVRLLTRQEVEQLGKHVGCDSLATVEVRAHDPLTHRPVLTAWPVHAAPEALLIPNFSPRGFSVKAHCQGHAGRQMEVGCQGATAHNHPLSCVVMESKGARQRREIDNFITHYDVPILPPKEKNKNPYIVLRKLKGLLKHPDFQGFIPQIGGCIGATAGCSICFVYIMTHNTSVLPSVCFGSCAVGVSAACIALFSRGIQYKMEHTVICTELFTQGQLSWDSYVADAAYGERLAATNPQALRGYQLMAAPLVAAMQVSPSLTSLVEILARPWIRHMEFEEGVAAADDPVGRLMTDLGLPLCSAVALLHHHIRIAGFIVFMTILSKHILK